MKQLNLVLACVLSVSIAPVALATESIPTTTIPSIDITASPTATGTGTASANSAATANPVQTVTANPVATGTGTATSTATANPIVSPTISPTITGGNSASNVAVGPVTAGGATLSNVGNGGGATLTGTVSGSNTLNGTVTGTNTNTNNVTGTNTNTVNATTGDQTVNNNVDASNSQHQGQHQSQSQSQTANGGNVQGSGNSSQAQSNTLSNVGNSSITINEAKPLPPAANIPSVTANAPTLFFAEGKPANATAARLAIEFLKQCPPTFDEVDVSEIRNDGTSGKTRAIFTPHSNYNAFKKPDVAPRVRVVMTPDQLPANKFKCTCLGLLQVEAYTADASDVGVATVINDAGLFARDKMRGYGDVKLVLIPAHALSLNMGADANASGFGVAPGFSGLLNSILATIGANASRNSGRTFPAAQVGATFAVVAGGDIPDGAVSIDLGAFMSALPAPTASPAK